MTHGFPQSPSPLFRSHAFKIENRPGLENQEIQNVLQSLSKIGAPNVQNSKEGSAEDAVIRHELEKYLSDWHLIAFLGTTQLFSEVRILMLMSSMSFMWLIIYPRHQNDMKILVRLASKPAQQNDHGQIDELLATESWQTLMTFARESARERFPPLISSSAH